MDFSNLTPLLSSSPLAALAMVFGAGVLTSLNPCIYPMIPITAAIVGGQSAVAVDGVARPRGRPIALTLTYVMGLASVYAGLGLFAGLTGSLFGTISSNPWLYFMMANVLIAGGLVMLDVIPLRVPQSLLARASTAGTAGRFSGVFGMGAMSGLVAAPCGAPVFAAVLTWVSTTQSAVLGFTYLFVFSLGMCTILIAVGISSGFVSRLPKPGVWMLWIKRGFAVVMIGVAQYYLVQMGRLI